MIFNGLATKPWFVGPTGPPGSRSTALTISRFHLYMDPCGLVVRRADDAARAHHDALNKGAEHLAGGVAVATVHLHHEDVGEASAAPEAHWHVADDGCRVCCRLRCTCRDGVHFARQEVDVPVVLDHVDSEPRPAAVVGNPAIQSTPIIPPRRDGSGSGWRSPRGPPCSALVR
jgi:hypothetical protein